MKKSPNKSVQYGKGLKCQNCGRSNWRFLEYLDKQKKYLMFYCTYCCLMFIKLCDFDNIQRKQLIKKRKREKK